MLNKDIAKLIGSYSKPRIWKYWIYDSWKRRDTFKNTHVIQANSEEELIQYLYDNHLDTILKNYKRNFRITQNVVNDTIALFKSAIKNTYLVRYEEITDY